MRPRRFVVALLVSGVLLGPSCSADDEQPPAAASDSASATMVGPEAFEARMGEPGVVTINVHTPDEGSISGTDLTIPFDQIADADELPADLDTPLAVYCRSGNMSADAVIDLEAMGYTDIVELEGGFDGWVASGRPLDPPAEG